MVNVLAGNKAWAKDLLAAVAKGEVAKSDLNSNVILRITAFKDRALNADIERVWGKLRDTPAEIAQLINTMRSELEKAPGSFAKGKAIFELTEVENGLFEPLRRSENLVFLQTQAAAQGRERTADAMFGDWAIMRAGGKQICQITLLEEAHDTENFGMQVKPGCDTLVTNFAPKSWRMDRGLLLVVSERSDPWRFEEEESGTWHRIPQGRQPLLLVRQ